MEDESREKEIPGEDNVLMGIDKMLGVLRRLGGDTKAAAIEAEYVLTGWARQRKEVREVARRSAPTSTARVA